MLLAAAFVFTYYTTWAMLLVRLKHCIRTACIDLPISSHSSTQIALYTTSSLLGSGPFVYQPFCLWSDSQASASSWEQLSSKKTASRPKKLSYEVLDSAFACGFSLLNHIYSLAILL